MKGDNFMPVDDKHIYNGPTLKRKSLLLKSKFFYLKVDPIEKRGKIKADRIASSAHASIRIKYNRIPRKFEKPAFAAMHGPHSLVQIGPGCADRA